MRTEPLAKRMKTSPKQPGAAGPDPGLPTLHQPARKHSRRHAVRFAVSLGVLLLAVGGCRREGRRFEPPGAPFVLNVPRNWTVQEAAESLVMFHGPPATDTILPTVPTIRLEWHPTPPGSSITFLSLSPDASLKDLRFLTSGNTTVGGGMLARWMCYSFQGDGRRVAEMDWFVQGEGCRLSCNLLTSEKSLEANEAAVRYLLGSLEMKERRPAVR